MSTSSLGFSSSNLSSLFQTSYANALKGKNALGSTSSLASSALFGSLAPGSNPLAPLQGQTAIMGLSGFVSGLQQSYAARKAAAAGGSATDPSALLSSLTGGSGSPSGMSSSDMLSALSSMLGMLGGGGSSSGSSSGLNSSLLNGFSGSGSGSSTLGFDQTGLGGLTGLNALNGTYQYPGSSTASAFDVSADQTSTASLASQLQSMLPALTTMMSMLGGAGSGSRASAGPGSGSAAASMLPQLQSMLSTLTGMLGGAAGAGTNSAYSPYGSAAGASPYSPYGASAGNTNSLTGANPLSSPTLFNQKVNMNLIDSAINQTLGSISNTLPMVRM